MCFNIPKMILISLLIAISLNVNALEDYKCKVERISFSSENNINVVKMYKNTYIGKEFSVERYTGLMSGVLKNSYITKPQVIDSGSKENAYKVVTTLRREEGAGAGTYVSYLNIREYEDSDSKPFIFVDKDVAFFGKCVHF